MEILGDVKHYDWGKLGVMSKVAYLAKISDKSLQVDNEKPYAELWMGDHCSGPSRLKTSNESLSDFIKSNMETVGGMTSLPFLFKVLSIRKALSIQVHPNKQEAERLHAERPDIYKDPNHKPELAIALTPFKALCGFRPFKDIISCLESYPEVIKLIGSANINKLKASPSSDNLKICFNALMRAKDNDLHECINSLLAKFKNSNTLNAYEQTFVRLNQDFPNDVGSLALFFLNLIELSPGEAINLAANVPHAYLDGDCIECMACSDNVIRAGLTPKYKDVDTLIEMLEYEGKSIEEVIYKPRLLGIDEPYSKAFIPQVKDFAIVEVKIPTGVETYKILNKKYGSILLVLSGEANLAGDDNTSINISEGSIIFLPATLGSQLHLKLNKTIPFTAYQAMYNDF